MDLAAEWAVAAGTLALACATAWMAWKTRDVASATRDAAEAAKVEAEAALAAAQAARAEAEASRATVDEIRRDRQLAWRPHLATTGLSVSKGPQAMSVRGTATNYGRGPAINCLHLHVDGAEWSRSELFSIPPEGSAQIVSERRDATLLSAVFDCGQESISGADVLVCQDALGDKLYRFIAGRAGADVWRASESRPKWAEAALQIEPQLQPHAG